MHPLEKDLLSLKNEEKAKIYADFFKTGKGQYGEGDIFLGITVPQQRIIAKKYLSLNFKDLEYFLKNPTHEYRFTSLVILTEQFKKANEKEKKKIFDFYIKQRKYINNWDLIDCTTPNIVGAYLFDKDKTILYKFAKSSSMWEHRIAILATLYFIKKNKFKETLEIAEILLNDKHDLIHKATGWMLRELGKKDQIIEEEFLQKNYKIMPRTMLRYAIERFPEEKRSLYMQKTFKA
ncbi:MAG: DNA alkylation repair protein [bacterium]|nr:DNA alkylation repair protein [bacterium]